jgi:hypothetical protein
LSQGRVESRNKKFGWASWQVGSWWGAELDINREKKGRKGGRKERKRREKERERKKTERPKVSNRV